jgi:outer membrane protein OmpA-like peptidoglycan-associated protein
MQKFVGAISIILLIAGTAFASVIRHKEYSYAYEFARGTAEATFVVCDCTSRKIPSPASKTAPTVIALKVSEPATVKPAPLNDALKQKDSKSMSEPFTDASLTVYFDLDSFSLRPEEREKLRIAPSLFKGAVTVTGHTCDIGSKEYNRTLSLKRAEAVAEHLRQIGVAPREITGKGDNFPVSDKKELNRRVEIKEVR